VESLASTRAKLRNELQTKLLAYRQLGASDLFLENTRHLYAWRSAGQYFRLARKLEGDEPAQKLLKEWMRKETHLSDWEVNQRQQNLDCRKAKYQEFAARLASRYETLVLERFDLRTFARRPAKETPRDASNRQESHQAEKARAQRHEAATSILRSILRNAFERRGGKVVEVSAVDTTRTCAECGLISDRDFAASVDWTCECGAHHDQDINASDNLCERWRAQEMAASARDDKVVKRESKWSRLKREKQEKISARETSGTPAE
jgi:transposase